MTTPDPLRQHDAANVLAALSGQERQASGPAILAGHPATRVHPALAPPTNKPVIIKRRVSAFSGSDLDVLPRPEDYRILTENTFPHQALVTTTYEGDLS